MRNSVLIPRILSSVVICLMWTLRTIQQSAFLVEPPSRGSLWRYGYNTTMNPDYDHLNCGGKKEYCNVAHLLDYVTAMEFSEEAYEI
ncbi:hypothetical protein CHS0354_008434 [Potamilus streckersoni]|uniref:Uncharacterized protein n=1 Tax=Potamilus streckersoni TaxID=2493646 RepID=A0AAE0RPW5_9BIVA|nr:hypothetical protein CHS0354_008434 [Potamilus streckersoni]